MKIIINSKKIECGEGEMLSDVLLRSGFAINMPCGGKGKCGKCKIAVTLNGKTDNLPACITRASLGMELTVEKSCAQREDKGDVSLGVYAAIDLGTTTVEAKLYDSAGGELSYISQLNPQRGYGADVISRIAAAKDGKTEELCRCVRSAVDNIITLWESDGAELESVYVVGNTVMQHLFAGVDPSPMGTYPYTPVFLQMQKIGRYILLPSVSAFIGADILAGIAFLSLDTCDGVKLLCDLGTNAEMVLSVNGKLYCTSAPAGPAIEGADIECGMGGSAGAVNKVWLDAARLSVATIGGAAPLGICGAGLADAIAVMLKYGIINKEGSFISEDAPLGSYVEDDKFYLASDVYISASDVRSFLAAKAAISAGIAAIVRAAGIAEKDIDTVYLSGGLGTRLNKDSVIATGILTKALAEKSVICENTALAGANASYNKMHSLNRISGRCVIVDLLKDADFTKEFICKLSFFT